MKKYPIVEIGECILCEICSQEYSEVFIMNVTGFIQVRDLDDYPEKIVSEAIKNCPADCIEWQETD